MPKPTLLALSLALLTAAPVLASPDHHAPPSMPKEFDTLKQLVGTWEGTMKMGDKDMKTSVVYALTSNGTAITETLAPGTPNEMVSVYHRDQGGKTLGMVHYCGAGNQPHMALTQATANKMVFEVKKPIGISSMKETHMHAVALTLEDPNTLTQEWTNYENGKAAGTMVFHYKRKTQ